MRGYIGQCVIVIRTVEIVYKDILNDTLLDGVESIWRTAAYHQGPPFQIILPARFFFSERI